MNQEKGRIKTIKEATKCPIKKKTLESLSKVMSAKGSIACYEKIGDENIAAHVLFSLPV